MTMEENRWENINTFDGVFWYEIRQQTSADKNKVHSISYDENLPCGDQTFPLYKWTKNKLLLTNSVFDNAIYW